MRREKENKPDTWHTAVGGALSGTLQVGQMIYILKIPSTSFKHVFSDLFHWRKSQRITCTALMQGQVERSK